MTKDTRPDWRGLTERIRVWQGTTFPAVTEEVGKWRTVNELAELGKKIASGAPIAEIREEAADVIITMQHMERIKEFMPAHKNCRMERSWLRYIGNALIWNRPAEAFSWLLSYFESESAAFAEVERKFAKNLDRQWDIGADGTGQHRKTEPTQSFTGSEDELAEALRRCVIKRDALAQTVGRVREAAVAANAHGEDEEINFFRGVMIADDILAILDGKEG